MAGCTARSQLVQLWKATYPCEISTPELDSIDSFIYLSFREALNLYTHPRQSKCLKLAICLSQILSYNTTCWTPWNLFFCHSYIVRAQLRFLCLCFKCIWLQEKTTHRCSCNIKWLVVLKLINFCCYCCCCHYFLLECTLLDR